MPSPGVLYILVNTSKKSILYLKLGNLYQTKTPVNLYQTKYLYQTTKQATSDRMGDIVRILSMMKRGL